MDGRNGWHVASFHGGAHDKTIINRMMLRFRPIAPKPDTGSSFPDGVSQENKNGLPTNKRVKRKYVRVRRHSNNSKRKNNIRSSISLVQDKKVGLDSATVTLQLMPEKTDGKDVHPSESAVVDSPVQDYRKLPAWINNNFKNMSVEIEDIDTQIDRTVAVPFPVEEVSSPVEKAESWVTVEFVTDTCMDAGVLGCTDVERINNLEKDTCPAFISDGLNIVKWVNEAYKRMFRQQGKGWSPETTMTAWLDTTKAKLPSTTAFSCMVRLQYSGHKAKCTKMVPCDVWRMGYGGFAWRLDVKAALSLGLS